MSIHQIAAWLLIGGSLFVTGAFADPPASPGNVPPEIRSNEALEKLATAKSSSPADLAALADFLEKSYESTTPPESVRMLLAIARGSQMGAGEGWFGPAQTRYTWEWLAEKHEIDPAKGIAAADFRGTPELYARLDRDRSGMITADDLDWSDKNAYVQQTYMINRMFRRMDREGNGVVSRDELNAFFEKVANGKDSFRSEDLRDALVGGAGSFLPGDAPTPAVLIRGLFSGEIGSLNEGPSLGSPAPDFRLQTHDGQRTIQLSEQFGTKPTVLVFGNFTCGPFRSMYPAVDDICKRFSDSANFLAVYVREAHPSDGWKMESNARVGVNVSQPQTTAERVSVAQQCHAKLNYSMPLLVDEIHDPVGNAYSGMPARLYVIDPQGRVAYKSGRGPFGFKSGEMEQALIMALLDQQLAASETAGKQQ